MPQTINPPLPSDLRTTSRELRKSHTDAEAKLWFHLRANRLCGLKFRRQHPFPPYVVDFYCAEAKLVVELDGSQHEAGVDAVRTAALYKQGLTLLRFWNHDVLLRTEQVLAAILNAVEGRTLTPTPLPEGEGL